MDDLIGISKEIVASDDEAKKIGLTHFEYAFYTAVSRNNSAKELMQHDQFDTETVLKQAEMIANELAIK